MRRAEIHYTRRYLSPDQQTNRQENNCPNNNATPYEGYPRRAQKYSHLLYLVQELAAIQIQSIPRNTFIARCRLQKKTLLSQ